MELARALSGSTDPPSAASVAARPLVVTSHHASSMDQAAALLGAQPAIGLADCDRGEQEQHQEEQQQQQEQQQEQQQQEQQQEEQQQQQEQQEQQQQPQQHPQQQQNVLDLTHDCGSDSDEGCDDDFCDDHSESSSSLDSSDDWLEVDPPLVSQLAPVPSSFQQPAPAAPQAAPLAVDSPDAEDGDAPPIGALLAVPVALAREQVVIVELLDEFAATHLLCVVDAVTNAGNVVVRRCKSSRGVGERFTLARTDASSCPLWANKRPTRYDVRDLVNSKESMKGFGVDDQVLAHLAGELIQNSARCSSWSKEEKNDAYGMLSAVKVRWSDS